MFSSNQFKKLYNCIFYIIFSIYYLNFKYEILHFIIISYIGRHFIKDPSWSRWSYWPCQLHASYRWSPSHHNTQWGAWIVRSGGRGLQVSECAWKPRLQVGLPEFLSANLIALASPGNNHCWAEYRILMITISKNCTYTTAATIIVGDDSCSAAQDIVEINIITIAEPLRLRGTIFNWISMFLFAINFIELIYLPVRSQSQNESLYFARSNGSRVKFTQITRCMYRSDSTTDCKNHYKLERLCFIASILLQLAELSYQLAMMLALKSWYQIV